MNPLLVNAAELLRRPGNHKDLSVQVVASDLGIHDARVADDAPVDIRAHLESLSDGVVVDARIDVPWTGTCRRCLASAAGVADVQVRELYQLTVTDPDAFPITGDQLDLGPMVREALLLDVPESPLCRDDCAGLCPVCGVDRNEESCGCDAAPRDDRWAALDALRDQLG